jgi:hypothetical protein
MIAHGLGNRPRIRFQQTKSTLKQGSASPSRDVIFAHFGTFFNDSNGTCKAAPITIAAHDDRVFVPQNISGERNGSSLDEMTVMVFTLDGGLVREMREFITPASRIKAFWEA